MLGSKLTLFFYGRDGIRDGHQPYSRGLLKGFPIKGGMTIPNIRSLDCGAYGSFHAFQFQGVQFVEYV